MARKLVAYLIYSLDGVVSDPDKWVYDRFDIEMMAHLKALIDAQGAVLLGRRTYREWSEYWPTSKHEPFSSFVNETPKYVASTTLEETTWRNSSVIQGSVTEAVGRMKQQTGKDIGVHGSITLTRSLLRANLVDELKLALFPVVVGNGRRLFEGWDHAQRLQLLDTQQTTKGVLVLTYQPKPT